MRHITVNILIALLLIFSVNAWAQEKRANKLYNNFYFAKAIPLFEKSLEKDSSYAIMRKLAFSYKSINNYEKAAAIYKATIKIDSCESLVFIEYADVLKVLNRKDDARTCYLEYQKRSPEDDSINQLLAVLDEELSKDSLQNVVIENLGSLNSKHSEFSPIVQDNRLIFVSDRPKSKTETNIYGWTNTPYVSLFETKITDNGYEKPKPMNSKINGDYHNGPITFCPGTDEFLVTRIDNKHYSSSEGLVNRAQIYIASGSKKPEETEFQHDDYSIAHPSITKDGKTLFFTSDMPGGFGGKDIYYCTKNDTGWSKPTNLGAEINTPQDEMFPHSKRGNVLYFSSNGHAGYGGMDIYSATKINDQWQFAGNMKMPINSSYDDFGIFFTKENKGILSSNRRGGLGSDDLYAFEIKKFYISGNIYGDKKYTPVGDITLTLIGADGSVIDTLFVDDEGFFYYDQLNPIDNYVVQVETSDTSFNGILDYKLGEGSLVHVILLNKLRGISDSLEIDNNGYFEYLILPSLLDSIKENGLVDINCNLFHEFEKLKAIRDMAILLKDDDGNLLGRTKTSEDGSFSFKSIDANESFVLYLDEEDGKFSPNIKYVITGEIVSNNTQKPQTNFELKLGNPHNLDLIRRLTNEDGGFRIDYLPTDYHEYKNLNSDDQVLELLNAEDTWMNLKELKKDTLIMQNIYFEVNSSELLNDSKKVLDVIVEFLKDAPEANIEIYSHTDARGNKNHNLELSKERAHSVNQYLLSNSISNTRTNVFGMGETQILNRCKDGVQCSEEEHKVNRRTEFKVVWSK